MVEVPEDWNVSPIFKKDKMEDLGNYGPVSFILLPGKVVLEQILLEAVSKDV